MPSATQSAGTEKFTDFEERRYTVRVVSCEDTTSPPPDNRPQYKWEMALEGSEDPETGAELVRRMWCSIVWNDRAEKESHLVLIARALIGPNVTFEQWEALGFQDLVGMRGSALVALDPKGYPTIDKATFRPVAGKAKAAAPVVAQAEAVAASVATPTRPTPPTRPLPPTPPTRPLPPTVAAGPPTITDDQMQRVREHFKAEGWGEGAEIAAWCAQNYGGRGLAQVRADEWESLETTLGIAPF